MADTLTIISEAEETISVIYEADQTITILDDFEPVITTVVIDGPIGPPDTRPRPSDIALNVFGDVITNEMLVRLEIGANLTLVPERCRASAETWPTSLAEIRITSEVNGINRHIANVIFSSNSATFTFSNNLIIEPGVLRAHAGPATFGLKDFSITLSGER